MSFLFNKAKLEGLAIVDEMEGNVLRAEVTATPSPPTDERLTGTWV